MKPSGKPLISMRTALEDPRIPLGVRLSPDVFPYCTPHFLARISLNLQEVTRTPIKVSV